MARKLTEQELHELFHKELPPITLPSSLSMQLRERVLAEVNTTLQPAPVENDALPVSEPEVVAPPTKSAPHGRRRVKRAGWQEQLGSWMPRLRPATSMFVAAATVAALVIFVVMIPRLLPGLLDTPPETGTGAETLPVVAILEGDEAPLTAQVIVQDETAQILRAGDDAPEAVAADAETVISPGDTLITQGGSAEIIFFPNQTTLLDPDTQVLLAALTDNNDGTQVLIQLLTGHARHIIASTLSPEDRFEVQTSLATASVVGTDFETTIQKEGTTLVTTHEGRVVVTRSQDGEVAEVEADHQLTVAADGALVVMPVSESAMVAVNSEPTITPTSTETEEPNDVAASEAEVTTSPVAPTATSLPQSVAMGSVDAIKTATPRPTATRVTTTGNSSSSSSGRQADATNTSTPTPTKTPTAAETRASSTVSAGTATPTLTPTTLIPTTTPTSTPTRISNPSSGSVATATTLPTDILRLTATPIVTRSVPKNTATPSATSTSTPLPTVTPLPTSTPKPTATPTLSPTPTLAATAIPVNRAPIARDDRSRIWEDDDTPVPVLINDSDPDFDSLNVIGVGNALHGKASISGPGTIYYVPDTDFSGIDTFTYTISDGELTSTATISINVEAINDAPSFVLGQDSVTVAEDAGSQIVSGVVTSISAGSVYEADQNLQFVLATNSSHLFAVAPTIDPVSGTLTFTAMPDANGTVFVTVGLTDSGGTANGGVDSAPAQTFSIIINPVNDAPSFALSAGRVVVDEDAGLQRLPGWVTEISAGASNESSQTLRAETTVDNEPLFSQQPAIDAQTGELTFAPMPDGHGESTVTIVLVDEAGARSEAQTFNIVVNPVNDTPSFNTGGSPVEVNEDAGLQIFPGWATDISAGAPNEALQTLQFEVAVGNGALFSEQPTIDAGSGDLTFTAGDNLFGDSIVTVVLVDGDGGRSAGQTFSIVVKPVNDAPSFVLAKSQFEVNADAGPYFREEGVTSISAGAANENEQSLAFELTVELADGTGSLFSQQPAINATTGELTFEILEGVGGSATVSVRLVETESRLSSEAQTFAIQVNPPAIAPASVDPASIDVEEGEETAEAENTLTP